MGQDGATRLSAPFRGGIPSLYCGHYTFVNGIERQELMPAMRRDSRQASFGRDSTGRYGSAVVTSNNQPVPVLRWAKMLAKYRRT